MHIGLIGGIGPAATDYYYRKLIELHERAHTRLDVTICHADTRDLVENLGAGRARAQAEAFEQLISRMRGAGSKAAAVTSMGGHFCIDELKAISSLPVIDALPSVNNFIHEAGLRTVGLLGTQAVMQSGLYGKLNGPKIVIPTGTELRNVHQCYVDMAIAGRATEEQKHCFYAAASALCREQGAEAVVLGGTDLFLAFEHHRSDYKVIDCALIHVRAIFDYTIDIEVSRNVASPRTSS